MKKNSGNIGLGLLLIGSLVAGAFGFNNYIDQNEKITELSEQVSELQEAKFGAFRPSGYTGKLLTRLTEGGSETSFNTTPCTTPDGQTITSGAIGDFIVITVNPGAANEEKISATSVSCSGTTLTWTIGNRGLSFASATTTITANKEQHAIGETVIISNDDHFTYTQYPAKDQDETITGTWTFENFPITASTTYASETVAGASELATQIEAASSTESGGTTRRLVIPASMATSTYNSATAALRVLMSGNDGFLDQGFLPTSVSKAIGFTGTTTMSRAYRAGETISGATLPVPVYASTTDGEYYATDANDANRYKFTGFAISNGTDGNTFNLQTQGIVAGFSGLTTGSKYYVQDTVGTIGTSPGTMAILVGIATSPTEILIQKGDRRALGTATFTDGGNSGQAQTSAVVTGFRPSAIRMTLIRNLPSGSGNARHHPIATGAWVNGSYIYATMGEDSDTTPGSQSEVGTSGIQIIGTDGSGEHWTITITSVTDTGFTITATQNTDSPIALGLTWEAEGEL
jgi:hypothetical protein